MFQAIFILWVLFILGFTLVASYIARAQRSPGFLVATFASLIVIANIVAFKQIAVFGLVAPAGVIAYSVTFLLTDMLSEYYSKKDAHHAVWAGFFVSLLMVVIVYTTVRMSPAPFWEFQEEYEAVFSLVPRIVLASIVAYLVSQHLDVLQFHLWRKKTGGKYLWLRNNASTVVSQAVDTSLFITIAFYGSFPIFFLIVGQYVIKLLIALLDTPFMYLSRRIYTTKL